MKLKLTFFLILLPSIACQAQCDPKLNSYAVGFNEIKASSFAFLDSSLNDVRIVGYGEDTHGTAEFTLLAKELMEYLSLKKG